MGIQILKEIQENYPLDSIAIITDNDAGAFYLANNEFAFGKFSSEVNATLCKKLAPEGKSTISYKYGDTVKTVKLTAGLDSLHHLLGFTTDSRSLFHAELIYLDSVYLKFNIFNTYGNSLINNFSNNLFLFSNTSNAGCYLSSTTKNDTVSLFQTFLSTTYYDSLFQELQCGRFANLPQTIIRDITKSIGIPISKIRNFSSFDRKNYILFIFFTGTADTVIDSSMHITQRLIHNLNVGVTDKKIKDNPLNLSLYNIILKIGDSILYNNNKYKCVSIAEFTVTEDFLYLPVAKLTNESLPNDRLFYLAQYSLEGETDQIPSKILYYPSGNFSEDCMIRSFKNNYPILANRITKEIDFGENKSIIHYGSFTLPGLENDSIELLFDLFPLNENHIQIMASTKKGNFITASIIDRSKIENIRILKIKGEPVFSQFEEENKMIVLSKIEHYLYSQKFKFK